MATPKTVLGGEDVRAIIADCGSWATRVGSAGDDTPRAIVPSAVGTRPSRKRAADSQEPPAEPEDVVMKDTSAPEPAPEEPKDPNAEYVGERSTPAEQPFKHAPPRAGDVVLTSPLAFNDVQPVYDFDRSSGRATVRDWDGMQAVWEASCSSLRLTPRSSPLLIVEPSHAWEDADRAKALERAFEGVGAPAAYVARGAAMAAFASARTTACVVDVGHQGAVAVPVVDGYTLQKSKESSVVGGLYLSEKLRDWTEKQLAGRPGYDGKPYDPKGMDPSRLRAHHELHREKLVADAGSRKFKTTDLCGGHTQRSLSESHQAFYRLKVIEEMKAYTFRVSQGKTVATEEGATAGKEPLKSAVNGAAKPKSVKKDDTSNDAISKGEGSGEKDNATSLGNKASGNGNTNQKSREPTPGVSRMMEYELPDGNVVSLGEDDGISIADELFTTSGTNMISLSDLAFRAVSMCDVDVRRDLFGGVVLTGGTSLISGTVERFSRELAVRTPQMYKLKVLAATNGVERSCGAWIGGSIVASLGTFQQAWISKIEYDELGSHGALRKCP